jgi:hypothetical protein
MLWRGEFIKAQALAKKDPARIIHGNAHKQMAKAEQLMNKNLHEAARSKFFHLQKNKRFKDLASYWVCLTYSLENNPLRAEDCFKDAKIDPEAYAKRGLEPKTAPPKSVPPKTLFPKGFPRMVKAGASTIGRPCDAGTTDCKSGTIYVCKTGLVGKVMSYWWENTGRRCGSGAVNASSSTIGAYCSGGSTRCDNGTRWICRTGLVGKVMSYWWERDGSC